jgi:phytoene dehydrogenase-like protein
MAEKSIAIIGGGIAGLSAGCYARMNGYETKIFEMHNIPGGVCTAWKRNGYTIDACIHWLVGSAPGVGYHQLWKEVGAVQGLEMLDLDEYLRVEGPDGKALILYGDVDRLEKHLLELAPEDARTIRSLTKPSASSRGSIFASTRRLSCTASATSWAWSSRCFRSPARSCAGGRCPSATSRGS